MAQLSESEQAKVQMMQDLEIEMMSDLYNRMTSACHKKCIAPKYHEAEMGEFRIRCLSTQLMMQFHSFRQGRERVHRPVCGQVPGHPREDRKEADRTIDSGCEID